MRPDVDTVIVAHDSGDLLLDAVRSAVEEVGEDRVWVVDAESTDGSIERVAGSFPVVHILPVVNAGFSAGNNRGIEATTSPYVLLLNPDAEVAPGVVAALVAAMEAAGPDVGIVAPLVLNSDGTIQAGSYGRFPSVQVRAEIALGRAVRALTRRRETPAVPAARTAVDWVTGAAMLVRRTAIEAAGPMDEAFFLYYEDVEWCHRMQDRGWRVLLEPSVHVVHHLGKSGAGLAEAAYREGFERYCDLYGLWGLKALSRVGVAVRRVFGGRG